MSQEALDTLLDEKGKQDVYSSSEHLGYSLVLMASLSYIYHSCIPVPHSCSCICSSGDKTNKQTNEQENKQTNKKKHFLQPCIEKVHMYLVSITTAKRLSTRLYIHVEIKVFSVTACSYYYCLWKETGHSNFW